MRMRCAIAGLFIALLCSCSPGPETGFALAGVTPTTARIDAGLAAVTVEPASRDRAVYPLPRSLTPLLPLWQAALQDAVTREGIFRPEASRRVSIVVKVLEFSLSGKILSVFARYQLFADPAGNPVFSADIMSNAGLSSSGYRGDEPGRPGGRDAEPHSGNPGNSGQHYAVSRPARSVRAAAPRRRTSPALSARKPAHSVPAPLLRGIPMYVRNRAGLAGRCCAGECCLPRSEGNNEGLRGLCAGAADRGRISIGFRNDRRFRLG